MTFKQAYKIAMEKSAKFREFDARVKAAQKAFNPPDDGSAYSGEDVGVLIFTVSAGESFYYGFDGVDLHAGKHTKRRAAILTAREEVLLIL